MSENLSAAEKRKLLRERRQQKFGKAGGSERLNKIIGKSDSLLSSESPLDNKSSTDEMEQLISNAQSKKAGSEKATPEVDPALQAQLDMFKKFAQQQQQQEAGQSMFPGAGSDATGGFPEMPDLFSQLTKGFPGAAGAGAGADPFGGANPFMETAAVVSPEVLKYHTSTLNQFKARSTFVKWVCILLPYIYFISHPAFFTKFQVSNDLVIQLFSKNNFFTVLTTLEVISISVYYQFKQKLAKKTKVTATSESKILGLLKMVPEGILPVSNLHGKVNMLFQYLDVFNLFVADLCFCLIVMGLMTYVHGLH